MLDGEDDYAILPLAEHGYIFPAETDEFTVEIWFYPKSEPKPKERHIILGQQKEDADRFEDMSGNGYTLIGMNGATVVGGEGVGNLEIRPDTSVTTTWGQIKSESF